MNKKPKSAIELHSAGATVRHQSPFEGLESYSSETEIDKAFVDKYVIPFYMVGVHNADQFISNYSKVKSDVTIEIAKQLFGNFNWRTRIVGAYFSAIENYKSLEDIIGTHLLKSEVCYAGGGYCMALASFNTEKGIQYLKEYLDYYLTRKELYFDQGDALAALSWMDNQNGTRLIDEYMPKYKEWASDKNTYKIESNISAFDSQMDHLRRIKSGV